VGYHRYQYRCMNASMPMGTHINLIVAIRLCLGAASLLDAPAWDEAAAQLLTSFAAEAAELQRALPTAAQVASAPAPPPRGLDSSSAGIDTHLSGDAAPQSDTRSHYHIVAQQIFEVIC
jgi:hypothetical protein